MAPPPGVCRQRIKHETAAAAEQHWAKKTCLEPRELRRALEDGQPRLAEPIAVGECDREQRAHGLHVLGRHLAHL